MRKLTEVIDNMVDLIPNHEINFITELESMRSSAAYCAPEQMVQWWLAVAHLLEDELGEEAPTSGWEFEVWKEWMGPTWEEYVDA